MYMKKLFHSDWQREIQFSGNILRKRGKSLQKEVLNMNSDWSISKESQKLDSYCLICGSA